MSLTRSVTRLLDAARATGRDGARTRGDGNESSPLATTPTAERSVSSPVMPPDPQAEPPLEQWASCSLCGVRSPLKTAFRFGKRDRCLCPACHENEGSRSGWGTLLTVGFWLALAAGAVLTGGKGNPGWVFGNLALLSVMQWLSILPHEAGHALAARAMGLQVWHIIIGKGRRIASWRLGTMYLDLHLFPTGGVTITEVRDQPWCRLRRFCVVAGGPLVNLVLMLAAIELGRDVWLAEQIERGPAPLFMFIVANGLMLVANLLPRFGRNGPSDGAQLLKLPFLRRAHFADLQRCTTLYGVELSAMRGNPVHAIVAAREALERYPGDAALQVTLSAALLNAQRFQEGRELLLQLLQEPTYPLMIRAVIYNNLSHANVALDDPALGAEALRLAALAHRWMPWAPETRVNLAITEALYGDCGRAVELLQKRRFALHLPTLDAQASSVLAFAYARQGQQAASQAALAAARAADASSPLLALIERRLQALPSGTEALPETVDAASA